MGARKPKPAVRLVIRLRDEPLAESEDMVPDANFLAQFRPPMTEEELAEAAKEFEQAVIAWLAEMDAEEGDP